MIKLLINEKGENTIDFGGQDVMICSGLDFNGVSQLLANIKSVQNANFITEETVEETNENQSD